MSAKLSLELSDKPMELKRVRARVWDPEFVYESTFFGPGWDPTPTDHGYVDASELGREIAEELEVEDRVAA
jgi:hypothetical protein